MFCFCCPPIDREKSCMHALACTTHCAVMWYADIVCVCFCAAVEAMVAVASRPVGVTHIWALHGLWLVAGAAGVGYAAHVKRSLQLALELLVSCCSLSPPACQLALACPNARLLAPCGSVLPNSGRFRHPSSCAAVAYDVCLTTGQLIW